MKTKHSQREIYLDFIGEPQDTQRRLERDRGIYQDYVVYTDDGIKVHIILLDVRFHYNEDAIGDRFGKRQIEWLETIFQEHHDSDVTLIGSGIHIIPQRPWTIVEDVGELAKQQILDLIFKYQKSGVILLTGDVHYA